MKGCEIDIAKINKDFVQNKREKLLQPLPYRLEIKKIIDRVKSFEEKYIGKRHLEQDHFVMPFKDRALEDKQDQQIKQNEATLQELRKLREDFKAKSTPIVDTKIEQSETLEQLDLEIYTLDKALSYFKRNKPQIETINDIYYQFDNNKLALSLIAEKALLTSANYQINKSRKKELTIQKIIYRLTDQDKQEPLDIVELANYEGSLADTIKNKEENRFVLAVNYQNKKWEISDIWSEEINRKEGFGTLNPHDPNIKNHIPEEGAKPFLRDSIVITKKNLDRFLDAITNKKAVPASFDYAGYFKRQVGQRQAIQDGNPNQFKSTAYQLVWAVPWQKYEHHSTFSILETAYLSCGVNQQAFEALINEEKSIPNGTSRQLWTEPLMINSELKKRIDYIQSNMPIFKDTNNRVNRGKFYTWAKQQGIDIPDEFEYQLKKLTKEDKKPLEKTTNTSSSSHLIPNEWLEKEEVTRPKEFTPTKGTPKSSGTANAIECVRIFYENMGYYPTETESWTTVRNSSSLSTGYVVEKHKTNVKIESTVWTREAHKEFYRRSF